MLLKNIKAIHNMILCSIYTFGPRGNTTHDHPPRTRLGPRPSSQRAGRRSGPRSAPTWAETGPSALGRSQPSIAWIVNLTVACAFRRYKNPRRPDVPLETLDHFTLLPPCLTNTSLTGGGGFGLARGRLWPATVRGGAARHTAATGSSLLPSFFSLAPPLLL
jgi:hypothetical protein